jgi:hypothetical protein
MKRFARETSQANLFAFLLRKRNVLESQEMPSPAWHRDVLAARMERVNKGESTYSDWADVKARIRKAT